MSIFLSLLTKMIANRHSRTLRCRILTYSLNLAKPRCFPAVNFSRFRSISRHSAITRWSTADLLLDSDTVLLRPDTGQIDGTSISNKFFSPSSPKFSLRSKDKIMSRTLGHVALRMDFVISPCPLCRVKIHRHNYVPTGNILEIKKFTFKATSPERS